MSENLNPKLKQFKSYYESKDYDKALEVLGELKSDMDPSLYEYNLGTVYFAKGDFLAARKSFQFAKENGFQTNESVYGLKTTKQELGVEQLEIESTFFEKVETLALTSSLESYVLITLIIVIIALYRRVNIFIRWTFLLCSILPLAFFYSEVSKHTRHIATQDISVLEGPSRMFEEVQLLPKGMVFIVKDRVDGWLKVTLPQSHAGWIKKSGSEKL